MKMLISELILLCLLFGCIKKSSGNVVGNFGPETIRIEQSELDLNIGDKINIVTIENSKNGNTLTKPKKIILDSGRVSAIYNSHFYEILTGSSVDIPPNAFIEK